MMPTGLNELKPIIQYQDLAKSVDPLIYTHTHRLNPFGKLNICLLYILIE